jgi:penicillin-binding protein-related factor A (putative recombinase)
MGQAFWSLEVIIFDSIRFFFLKEQNRFFKKEKPKPVQTDWFRSGSVSLEQKPIKIDLARFFFSVFFCLGSVFSVSGL